MKAIVLVAITDPFRLELVQEACETVGYEVVLAADTASALSIIARQPPSVVIADGACAELASVLREDKELSAIPVVVAGAVGGGLKDGIREPLRVDEVQRVVRKVLRQAKDARRQHRSSHHVRAVGDVTGAGDIHHLRLSLPYELTEAQRYRRPLGCVVLQCERATIDAEFPRCLELIRETDLAFRTAPNEIVLLLPEADDSGVALVIGRIASVCADFRFGAVVVSGDQIPDDVVAAARTRLC